MFSGHIPIRSRHESMSRTGVQRLCGNDMRETDN